MANEISLKCFATYAKSGKSFDSEDLDFMDQSINVSGEGHIRGTGTALTSASALPLGAVVTCGMLWFKNRGVNPIHLRMGSSAANTVVFPAGVGYCVYLSGNTPYVIAVGGTSAYEYELIEA